MASPPLRPITRSVRRVYLASARHEYLLRRWPVAKHENSFYWFNRELLMRTRSTTSPGWEWVKRWFWDEWRDRKAGKGETKPCDWVIAAGRSFNSHENPSSVNQYLPQFGLNRESFKIKLVAGLSSKCETVIFDAILSLSLVSVASGTNVVQRCFGRKVRCGRKHWNNIICELVRCVPVTIDRHLWSFIIDSFLNIQ